MNIYEQIQNSILHNTSYRGIPTYKNPMDAWTYQEIINATLPDVIIEIGNKFGGSTLMLKDICSTIGYNVKIIAIDLKQDIAKDNVKQYYNDIEWITGDASDRNVFNRVSEILQPMDESKIMVIEDSAHTYENTLLLLNLYSGFVSSGCYYIVEDTVINHGLTRKSYGEKSAYEAVEEFMSIPFNKNRFEIDHSRERSFTWNPGGYLLRK